MKAKEIYNKIEFWLVTIVGAAFFLTLLVMARNAEDHSAYRFEEYRIKFIFWKHLFIPLLAQIIIYYCGYISFNKILVRNI